MYPNIPTDEKALKIVENFLKQHKDKINFYGLKIQHVMQLLKFILKNTYVTYKEKFYIQTQGVGTGCHTSCIFSEIIVDYTYITAIEKAHTIPLSVSNYVDDSLLIWPGSHESFIKFRDLLGSIWPTIKFNT